MTALQTQKRKLDRIVAKTIATNEQGRCFCCDKPATDAAHLLSKGAFPSLRFSFQNIHMLCRECHTADHSGANIYLKQWLKHYGHEAYERLRAEGRSTPTLTMDEMKELCAELGTKY